MQTSQKDDSVPRAHLLFLCSIFFPMFVPTEMRGFEHVCSPRHPINLVEENNSG